MLPVNGRTGGKPFFAGKGLEDMRVPQNSMWRESSKNKRGEKELGVARVQLDELKHEYRCPMNGLLVSRSSPSRQERKARPSFVLSVTGNGPFAPVPHCTPLIVGSISFFTQQCPSTSEFRHNICVTTSSGRECVRDLCSYLRCHR